MSSLYGRLFTYRERPHRIPLEDFLTEALADLLNRTPTSEMVEFVSKFFLPDRTAAKEAWQELVKTCSSEGLQWVTRSSIHVGTKTLYPDLTLFAGEERHLLIVENKISCGIGEHKFSQLTEGEDAANQAPSPQLAEIIDQLATYGHWLSSRCEHPWPGAIALLTHFTAPPAGFGMGDRNTYGVEWQRVCKWHHVWSWLIQASKPSTDSSTPAWQVLAAELAEFLAEQKMNVESFTFYDTSAAEIFIKSAARFNRTFKQIRDELKPQWILGPAPPRGVIEYNGDGAVLVDWMFLRSPHSPGDKAKWFIGWVSGFQNCRTGGRMPIPLCRKLTTHSYGSGRKANQGSPSLPQNFVSFFGLFGVLFLLKTACLRLKCSANFPPRVKPSVIS